MNERPAIRVGDKVEPEYQDQATFPKLTKSVTKCQTIEEVSGSLGLVTFFLP